MLDYRTRARNLFCQCRRLRDDQRLSDDARGRYIKAEEERRKVYFQNAELRTQMQAIMDGLNAISWYIEPHMIGATGRMMTPKEILEYIIQLGKESENQADLIDKLVDALKSARSKANEVDAIIDKALKLPE